MKQLKPGLGMFSTSLKLLTLLSFAGMWYGALPQVKKEETQSHKQLTKSAQAKIMETLAGQDRNSISVFNLQGDFKRSVAIVTEEQLAGHASLQDFLLKKNPIDTCKNPVPAPPPPCVICDDGTVVCSRANFTGQAKKYQ
jgi:hypothetical protein